MSCAICPELLKRLSSSFHCRINLILKYYTYIERNRISLNDCSMFFMRFRRVFSSTGCRLFEAKRAVQSYAILSGGFTWNILKYKLNNLLLFFYLHQQSWSFNFYFIRETIHLKRMPINIFAEYLTVLLLYFCLLTLRIETDFLM